MGGDAGQGDGRATSPLLVALAAAVVGAAGTYVVTLTSEQDKRRLQLETAAFQAYADAQAAYIFAPNAPARDAAAAAIRRASVSIALFADVAVVDKLAAFIARLDQRAPCALLPEDIAVYQAIRAETAGAFEKPAPDAAIAMALFGCALSGS